MMKIGKNQELLPSGVVASKDRKYYYWQCSKTGLQTFANAERFKKVLAVYKTEANLVKTFVAAPVKKYLAADFELETIKNIIKNNGGKLPPIGGKKKKIEKVKKVRRKSLKSFAVGKVEVKVQTPTGSFEVEAKPVYPWSDNPDYFKTTTNAPLSIEAMTTESCAYPNRYLDDECRNCPIYDRCALKIKYTPEDWKKPAKRNEVKIKVLKSFETE